MMGLLLGYVQKRIAEKKPFSGVKLYRRFDGTVLSLHDVFQGELRHPEPGLELVQVLATHGAFDFGQLAVCAGEEHVLLVEQVRDELPVWELHRVSELGLRRDFQAKISRVPPIFHGGRFSVLTLSCINPNLEMFGRVERRGVTSMERELLSKMGVKNNGRELLHSQVLRDKARALGA